MGVVVPNEIETPKTFKHFVFLEKKNPWVPQNTWTTNYKKKKDKKIGVLRIGFVASVIVNQGISQAYEIKTNKKLRCDRKNLGVHFCFKCSSRSPRYSRILKFFTSLFVLKLNSAKTSCGWLPLWVWHQKKMKEKHCR
jgi:hypothetical protein